MPYPFRIVTCEACGARLSDDARFCSACGTPVRRDAAAQSDPLRDALQRALPSNLRIVRPLGRGGMGAVYLAHDEFLDREVAIKTLPTELDTNDAFRERFRREARIAAKLHHPHIVPLHTFGEGEHILYYVMGFVRGETLAQRLAREEKLDPEEVRRIVAEIADALSYAHAQSVVHRDLKPENILIDDATGATFLADFGIARLAAGDNLTRTGAVLGTPLYMSPEQASGTTVDHRTDIYSLGVIAYRMLTGRFPVAGATFAEVIAQHTARRPEPAIALEPETPMDLNEAVMRCLDKDPKERFATAAELRKAISGTESEPETANESLRSAGSYVVVLLWFALLLTPIELFFWADVGPGWRILIELVQLLPFFLAGFGTLRALEARKAGITWRAIGRSAFHPPSWYWGWTPSGLRPRGDVWNRLPPAVRMFRHAFLLTVLAATVLTAALPVAILSAPGNRIVRGVAFAWIALLPVGVVFAIVAERTLKRAGLSTAEASAVMYHPSWQLSKSRQPGIAALFHPTSAPRAVSGAADATTLREAAASIAALDAEEARLAPLVADENVAALERKLAALEGAGPEMMKLRQAVETELEMSRTIAARLEAIRQERARLAVLDSGGEETVARS